MKTILFAFAVLLILPTQWAWGQNTSPSMTIKQIQFRTDSTSPLIYVRFTESFTNPDCDLTSGNDPIGVVISRIVDKVTNTNDARDGTARNNLFEETYAAMLLAKAQGTTVKLSAMNTYGECTNGNARWVKNPYLIFE